MWDEQLLTGVHVPQFAFGERRSCVPTIKMVGRYHTACGATSVVGRVVGIHSKVASNTPTTPTPPSGLGRKGGAYTWFPK